MFSEVTYAISSEKSNLGSKLVDARNNLLDIHLIKFLRNEFCFFCLSFQKPATSINGYSYKMTLPEKQHVKVKYIQDQWYQKRQENPHLLTDIN